MRAPTPLPLPPLPPRHARPAHFHRAPRAAAHAPPAGPPRRPRPQRQPMEGTEGPRRARAKQGAGGEAPAGRSNQALARAELTRSGAALTAGSAREPPGSNGGGAFPAPGAPGLGPQGADAMLGGVRAAAPGSRGGAERRGRGGAKAGAEAGGWRAGGRRGGRPAWARWCREVGLWERRLQRGERGGRQQPELVLLQPGSPLQKAPHGSRCERRVRFRRPGLTSPSCSPKFCRCPKIPA